MSALPFSSLPRPLLFGHRGASAEAPENTLEAFERAIAAGVDVLEMDLHLSADGVIVVHHDDRLDRTTNGRGLLCTKTFEQLRGLDAGYHFVAKDGRAFRGRGCRIPRLVEVLDAFPSIGFNIELKQHRPSMVASVLAELARVARREVLLAAADDRIMRELESSERGFALGLSESQCWRVWLRAMLGLPLHKYRGRALQVPPMYRGVLPVTPERVLEAARAAGIEIHLWTINDASRASHWLARGVDGIMSDDPRSVIDAVKACRSTRGKARSLSQLSQ